MPLLRHSQTLVATLTAALVLGGCAAPRQPSTGNTDARIRLLAQAHIAAGTEVLGTPWGGISGIDYDAQSGQLWLISDDRSAHAPARIYTARWAPAQQPTQPHQTRILGAVLVPLHRLLHSHLGRRRRSRWCAR